MHQMKIKAKKSQTGKLCVYRQSSSTRPLTFVPSEFVPILGVHRFPIDRKGWSDQNWSEYRQSAAIKRCGHVQDEWSHLELSQLIVFLIN